MTTFPDRSNELFDQMISLRRKLHQNPELGFREVKTSAAIASALEEYGLKVEREIAQTGLVTQITGKQSRVNGMLRFDMDALPIQEETGLDFASLNPGVMHACGHDGHMAIGLTTARMLQEKAASLDGTMRVIFQPAEEGDGGAKQMISEGVLEHPRPDFILGLHLWNEKPLGWVGIKSGPLMAGSDTLEIKVKGKGGHGGLPQQTVDPIVCSAQIVTALQSIVSRNLSPFENAVLSLTAIHGGTAFNITPDEIAIKGTLRTFEPQVRERILQRMGEIIQGISAAMGCEDTLNVIEVTSPVVNDTQIAHYVTEIVSRKYPALTIDDSYQTTVSEDFAFYLEQVPGCFILFGSANPAKGKLYSHHHPKFDFDEDALPVAAALMADCSSDLLLILSESLD